MYSAAIDTRYHDVWIVVPAFNEASVIGDVIADVRSVFEHVVCVDDGSRDDTGERALRGGRTRGAAIPSTSARARRSRPASSTRARQPGAQVFATFDADGQHRVKDVVRDDRPAQRRARSTWSSAPGSPAGAVSRTPLLKTVVLRTAAWLSPRTRKLGLTDAHNGLRVFNKTVADGLNITMNGMSHASEFIALAYENHWRVAEEPVEILYTDYSKSKGQPLLNGVNIVFDGLLRGRMPR